MRLDGVLIINSLVVRTCRFITCLTKMIIDNYVIYLQISQEVSDVLNKALCNVEPALTNMDSTHPRFVFVFLLQSFNSLLHVFLNVECSYTEFCKVAGDCHARLGELHHQSSLSSSVSPYTTSHHTITFIRLMHASILC